MRLEGAHDSRAVNRRARGAETRRPRASGGLCRAWGSLLQGLPPNPMAHGPRACPRGRSRFVSTRTDSWAYGCKPLLIFAQPVPNSRRPTQTACPIYAYTLRQTKTTLYTLSQITAEAAEGKLRA